MFAAAMVAMLGVVQSGVGCLLRPAVGPGEGILVPGSCFGSSAELPLLLPARVSGAPRLLLRPLDLRREVGLGLFLLGSMSGVS